MASVINGTNIVLYEYDSNAIYYFNGGTAQGTFDSIVCKELSRSQVAGTSVDFTKTGAGTIASFITDALDPGVTTIPAGTWTFSASQNYTCTYTHTYTFTCTCTLTSHVRPLSHLTLKPTRT